MKKTKEQIAQMKDSGVKHPVFWEILCENGHFLHIRNRFTREHRVCRK